MQAVERKALMLCGRTAGCRLAICFRESASGEKPRQIADADGKEADLHIT